MILAKRRFSPSDQTRFASISGDHNPMHLDALRARRTQAGAPVVHGINLLLWALDSLAAARADLPPLCQFDAYFNNFVYVGEDVEVVLAQPRSDRARLNISVDGVARSKVSIKFGETVESCPDWPSTSLMAILPLPSALNRTYEELNSLSGWLPFQMTPSDAVSMFPAASKWLGDRRIATLASTSHLTGMICPGLHSVYSELTVNACAESGPPASLAFRVTEMESRFQAIDQEIVGGGLRGVVKSFVRKPPAEQASMASLNGVIAPTEFAGTVALVIGGTRGLGELTAKLIAAGGGRVVVTWQTGKDDADRVAQEIRAAGGSCLVIPYDAGKPAAEQLALLAERPTHAYYFATPAIFRPRSAMFISKRLNEFMDIYVTGFWEFALAMRARRPALSIFYPSSVAVAERPHGMTEYAMAKAAGEILCDEMNTSLAPMHVTVRRLPRLPTDQTASITAAETALPLETMIPIIREVQSWPQRDESFAST
jgi:hypothetical protein